MDSKEMFIFEAMLPISWPHFLSLTEQRHVKSTFLIGQKRMFIFGSNAASIMTTFSYVREALSVHYSNLYVKCYSIGGCVLQGGYTHRTDYYKSDETNTLFLSTLFRTRWPRGCEKGWGCHRVSGCCIRESPWGLRDNSCPATRSSSHIISNQCPASAARSITGLRISSCQLIRLCGVQLMCLLLPGLIMLSAVVDEYDWLCSISYYL